MSAEPRLHSNPTSSNAADVNSMKSNPELLGVLFKRELSSYFATPLALVFVVIFLVLSGVFTFYLGNFYERNQADLNAFFNFHPWLYLFLVPAIAMRTWAEERRSGTLELLMTMPVTLWQAVAAKFLAAWVLLAIALLLTFPMWFTVNYLGSPDNGVILAAYLGSWLMGGSFVAVGTCLSAATRSQVVAFILTIVLCFMLVLAGFPMVLDAFSSWAPQWLVDAIAYLSFLSHFEAISRGLLDVRDIFFFVAFIVFWLLATAVVLDLKKAE